MQKKKLRYLQEQEKYHFQAGAEKVLSFLRKTSAAQRKQVVFNAGQ